MKTSSAPKTSSLEICTQRGAPRIKTGVRAGDLYMHHPRGSNDAPPTGVGG